MQLHGERNHFLLGAGGHASVLFNIATKLRIRIAGVVLPPGEIASRDFGLNVIDESRLSEEVDTNTSLLLNGVGPRPGNPVHYDLFLKWTSRGYRFASLIDPMAVVESTVEIGEGVTVVAGAILQTGVRIGAASVINTAAVVDHDCILGPGAFIGPNATLCGDVQIGSRSFVGASATVLPGVRIGDDALIGAGCTVSRDVETGSTVRLLK